MTRSHSYRHWIATGLAHAFLADAEQAGGRSAAALQARAMQCVDGDAPWIRSLAAAVATEFSRHWEWHTVPTLAAWLCELPQLARISPCRGCEAAGRTTAAKGGCSAALAARGGKAQQGKTLTSANGRMSPAPAGPGP